MTRSSTDNFTCVDPINGLDAMDWQLLSDHLDEALAPGEMQQLLSRLPKDPLLAAALEQLRAAQQDRAAVWSSLEPTEDVARDVADKVMRAARRHDLATAARRWTRTLSAAAASIAVGLSAGWWLWGRTAQMTHPFDRDGVVAVTPVQPVSTFQVALTDAQGHVVAVQNFPSREAAESFAHDLGQLQRPPQEAQPLRTQPVSDHF